MFQVNDRIKEVTSTQGQGPLTLGGSIGAFRSFLTGLSDGVETYYAIENGVRWEVGKGTFTSPNILTRDIVYGSSNGTVKIVLEGTSTVFCTLPASKAFLKDPDNNITVSGIFADSGVINNFYSDMVNVNGDVNVSGDLYVDGNLNSAGSGSISFTSDVFANNLTVSGDLTSSGFLTLIRDNSAGCFLHAYKDDVTNRTFTLHFDADLDPQWNMGLKTTPTNRSNGPTYAYMFGRGGTVGMVSDATNWASMSDSNGLTVYNDSNTIFNASTATGVYIDALSSAYPSLVVNAPTLASEDIQRWEKSDGSVYAVVDSGGKFGIFTSSPVWDLDVVGSGRFSHGLQLGSGGIRFDDGTTATSASTTGTPSGIAFFGDDGVIADVPTLTYASGDQTLTIKRDGAEIAIRGNDDQLALLLGDRSTSSNNAGRIIWYVNGTNYGFIEATASHLNYQVNSSTRQQKFNSAAGNTLFIVDGGNEGYSTFVTTQTTTDIAQIVAGTAGQIANLQEWRNSSQETKASVSNDGTISTSGGIQFSDGSLQTSHYRIVDSGVSDYSFNSTTEVVIINAAAPANVYIPTAVGVAGKEITVKRHVSGSALTLNASGSQSIDGSATLSLSNVAQVAKLLSDGENWHISSISTP